MAKSAKKINSTQPRIIGFVCNWEAYSGVEMAGVKKTRYPAGVRLVRLACLGRLHTGLILKAFELGAAGVILLGCPAETCHYESGMKKAKEVFAQSKKLLPLLGIDSRRLELVEVPAGGDNILVKRLSAFVKHVNGGSPRTAEDMQKEVVRCQR